MDTQETKDKLDEYINTAYDYIANVLRCQGRWLNDDEMYSGYESIFPIRLRLLKTVFIAVYSEIKVLGHDNPNFFKPEGGCENDNIKI